MKPSIALTILIFALVAIGHALRLFYGWPVTINGAPIPMSVSVLGLIVMLIMIPWLWYSCCPRKKGPEQNQNK